MLPRLVDDRCRQEFERLEFAHREAIKPRLMAAGQAVNLRAPDVPELDIDAVRAALAEQESRHSWRV